MGEPTPPNTPQPLELPELFEAVLDDATFAALVRDLEALAEIERISVKGAPSAYADPTPDQRTLKDALTALEQGAVRGVQIHYRWNAQRWCDTLLRTGESIRLTRIGCPFTDARGPGAG